MSVTSRSRSNPASVMPRNNPGTWVQTNDYPPEALRNETEGVVGFQLSIGKDGLVKDCQISSSSGSPVLDQATCKLVSMRARFAAATDAKGYPIESTFSNRVRWVLPKDVEPPVEGVQQFSFIVEADGTQTDCRIIQSKWGSAGQPVGPMPCRQIIISPVYRDAKGNPIRKRVTMTETTVIEDVKD